jgi:hypothetical protein
MMKTCPFVPFPDAFNAKEVLEGTKIASQTIDLYERPADKLGTHFLTFDITQKQIILGLTKRTLHLDFYRKRLSIRGGFEGIVFEVRGHQIKSWDQDTNEHTLVRIIFNISSNAVQEFWLEDPAEYPKLAEALTEFREVCMRNGVAPSAK